MNDFPSYKPSELRIDSVPFLGTLGKAEYEYLAAFYVVHCQINGNEWADVKGGDIMKTISQIAAMRLGSGSSRHALYSLATFPLLTFDADGMTKAGFLRFVRLLTAGADFIRLTRKAFDRIAEKYRIQGG